MRRGVVNTMRAKPWVMEEPESLGGFRDLVVKRTADGPEAGKHRTRFALRQLTSTETEILSHLTLSKDKNTEMLCHLL